MPGHSTSTIEATIESSSTVPRRASKQEEALQRLAAERERLEQFKRESEARQEKLRRQQRCIEYQQKLVEELRKKGKRVNADALLNACPLEVANGKKSNKNTISKAHQAPKNGHRRSNSGSMGTLTRRSSSAQVVKRNKGVLSLVKKAINKVV